MDCGYSSRLIALNAHKLKPASAGFFYVDALENGKPVFKCYK